MTIMNAWFANWINGVSKIYEISMDCTMNKSFWHFKCKALSPSGHIETFAEFEVMLPDTNVSILDVQNFPYDYLWEHYQISR